MSKSVTGYTPAELLFGSSLTLDANLFAKDKEVQDILEVPINEWLASRCEQQLKAITAAKESQEQYDRHHTDITSAEVTTYNPGEWVLKKYPSALSGANGRPNKLHTNLKGPYKIKEKVADDEYLLTDAHNKTLRPVSVHLLRPYQFDSTRTDPSKEGYTDTNSWEVEKIVSHRHKSTNKHSVTKWLFTVKWLDYPDTENTEEPWSQLRDNVKLHEYLTSINKSRLIPKKYQDQTETEVSGGL
jgi:hypothetical protein